MTKIYMIKYIELDGERKYDNFAVIEVDDESKTIEQAAKEFMEDFYGEDTEWDEYMQAWNDGGVCWVRLDDTIEISEQDYAVLKRLGVS